MAGIIVDVGKERIERLLERITGLALERTLNTLKVCVKIWEVIIDVQNYFRSPITSFNNFVAMDSD